MKDSNGSDPLAGTHERNREERIAMIKRWVAYVESTDPDVWGEQLNTLVEAQLDAARGAGISAEQRRRVEEAGREYREESRSDETSDDE